MPLPDTIVDFWHLVYDQESPVIIMLDEAQSQVHLTMSFYGGVSTHILVTATMDYFIVYFDTQCVQPIYL